MSTAIVQEPRLGHSRRYPPAEGELTGSFQWRSHHQPSIGASLSSHWRSFVWDSFSETSPLTTSTSVDHGNGRYSGRLNSEQKLLFDNILLHREWIRKRIHGSKANGVANMEELSFCRRTWSPHFNQGGASNTRYVIVEDDPDPTMEVFAAAVEAFSTSLIETVDNAIDANLGVDPDVPPGALVCGGGQLSNGFSRGWHTDRVWC